MGDVVPHSEVGVMEGDVEEVGVGPALEEGVVEEVGVEAPTGEEEGKEVRVGKIEGVLLSLPSLDLLGVKVCTRGVPLPSREAWGEGERVGSTGVRLPRGEDEEEGDPVNFKGVTVPLPLLEACPVLEGVSVPLALMEGEREEVGEWVGVGEGVDPGPKVGRAEREVLGVGVEVPLPPPPPPPAAATAEDPLDV